MPNFSNQIHPTVPQVDTARLRLWLTRNYQRHLSDSGAIDAESLGEALAWEFALDRMAADDLAALFAVEFDRGI